MNGVLVAKKDKFILLGMYIFNVRIAPKTSGEREKRRRRSTFHYHIILVTPKWNSSFIIGGSSIMERSTVILLCVIFVNDSKMYKCILKFYKIHSHLNGIPTSLSFSLAHLQRYLTSHAFAFAFLPPYNHLIITLFNRNNRC